MGICSRIFKVESNSTYQVPIPIQKTSIDSLIETQTLKLPSFEISNFALKAIAPYSNDLPQIENRIVPIFKEKLGFTPYNFEDSVQNQLVLIRKSESSPLPKLNLSFLQERLTHEVFGRQTNFLSTKTLFESALALKNVKHWDNQRAFALSYLEVLSLTICVFAVMDIARHYFKKNKEEAI